MPPKKRKVPEDVFNFMDWVRYDLDKQYDLAEEKEDDQYANTIMHRMKKHIFSEDGVERVRIYMPDNGQSWIDYYKYSPEASEKLFNELDKDDMYPERGKSRGSTVPRDYTTFWRGGDVQVYPFGGKKHVPRIKVPRYLQKFYENMERLYPGKQFNFAVVNRYKSSCDSISAHADDEKEIIPNSEIASLSLGATRDFIITNNPKAKNKI